jgi:hypothetical protein
MGGVRVMDPAYLVVLAVKLAILTFYIGVLVYALPLPFSTVKRWGPQLLWDGVLALFLATIYAILYSTSNRLALMLGGSWTLFNLWYSAALSVSLNLKMVIAALTAIPEVARLAGPVYAVALPLDRAATLAILFLTTLAGIAELVYNYGLVLVAFGVVLYATPFRITRGAGAWLIAFILVFSIGLQTLPLFISSFASKPQTPEVTVDYRLLKVRVESSRGDPIAYGVLVLMDSSGRVIASYMVDGGGYAKSKYLEGGMVMMPASELYAYIEFDGVLFPLKPRPLRAQEYSNGQEVVVRAPHIIISKYPLILAYSSVTDFKVVDGGSWFAITSYLNLGDFIEIRYPKYCNLNITSNYVMASGEWAWRGVNGVYSKLNAGSAGVYEVMVQINGCSQPHLPSDEGLQDYVERLSEELKFIDVNLLKAFILYYLTVPTIYVFMLFLATGALARILGGRDRVPVRVA